MMRLRVLVCAALLAGTAAPALAQESAWSFAVRGGVLAGSSAAVGPAGSQVTLKRPSPLVTIDAIRALDCCVELYFSGSIPRISVESTDSPGSDATISPEAIQIGMNYRFRRPGDVPTKLRRWWYVGPFIGGFLRDQTARADGTAFRFPGGWGIGVGGGFRYRKTEHLAFDFNVKWQHLPLLVSGGDRLSWNPVTVTGGFVARLF